MGIAFEARVSLAAQLLVRNLELGHRAASSANDWTFIADQLRAGPALQTTMKCLKDWTAGLSKGEIRGSASKAPPPLYYRSNILCLLECTRVEGVLIGADLPPGSVRL